MRREIHPARDWRAYGDLLRTLREFRPEVVHTHSAKGGFLGRAAAWKLEAPSRSICPRCGVAKVPHVVCGNCGWYHGRQAIEVD